MKFAYFIRQFSMGLVALCIISSAHAVFPLWTFSPNSNYPPKVSILSTQSANVVYTVKNQSHKAKSLVIQPIAGVVQSLPCQLAPKGQPGSSCSLLLSISGNALPAEGVHTGPILCEANPNGTPNANQCYRPSAVDTLNISLATPAVGATISVDPFIILIAENSSQVVTITNSQNSPTPALNVASTIPGGSSITAPTTTCGQSLAIGATCTITFQSTNIQEGPTTIPIKGNNTNSVNVYAAVSDQPLISITSPSQQALIVPTSGSPLALSVTNNSDVVYAQGIDVTNKTACPNLLVDNSNCITGLGLAPQGSCQLIITNPSATPYAPCTITISGTNTGNSPTTLIAFSHLGGLIFQSNGTTGSVVIDSGSAFNSEWTNYSFPSVANAFSDTDGVTNTDAIVASSACFNYPNNCAAQRCRNIAQEWYLPAKNQLQSVIFALCPGSSYPCAFGNFISTFYWSSTEWFADTNAYSVDVPDGNFGPTNRPTIQPVRCIRDF